MADFTRHILTPYEAGHLLQQSLEPSLTLLDLGSRQWRQQHTALEKLNLQAHLSAKHAAHDEFIVELVLQFSGNDSDLTAVQLLVSRLVVTSTWKQSVYPTLVKQLDTKFPSKLAAQQPTYLQLYLQLYSELTTLSLLEVLLYRREVCDQLHDYGLDLIEYAMQYLHMLNGEQLRYVNDNDATATATSIEQQLSVKHQNLQFTAALTSLTLLRYLIEHISSLPLGAVQHLLVKYDIILALCHVAQLQPWRRVQNGATEKYVDHKWQKVDTDDTLSLCHTELQVWLALNYLLTDTTFTSKYEITAHRRTSIIQLRPLLHTELINQLPLLQPLQRSVEHLVMMNDPPISAVHAIGLVEVVAPVREQLQKQINVQGIVEHAIPKYFDVDSQSFREQAVEFASTYNLDYYDDLLTDVPTCSECGSEASQRCSRCKNEWYCSRQCQVKQWKQHKQLCDLLTQDAKQQEQARQQPKATPIAEPSIRSTHTVNVLTDRDTQITQTPAPTSQSKKPLIEVVGDDDESDSVNTMD